MWAAAGWHAAGAAPSTPAMPAAAGPTKDKVATGKTPAPLPKKPLVWGTNNTLALSQQQKTDKLILYYFSGSGWDDFTQELDDQVLNTDLFRDWAEANVIPFRVDFPKDRDGQSRTVAKQNEALKLQFNISKVPMFLFVDSAGDVQARVGYDTARLRPPPEETKGNPKAWIAYCDSVVKAKPPTEELKVAKSLKEAVAYSRKNAIPLALFISQGNNPTLQKDKEAIMKHPAFSRFCNKNMSFLNVQWPEASDTSPAAVEMRAFGGAVEVWPGAAGDCRLEPGRPGRV